MKRLVVAAALAALACAGGCGSTGGQQFTFAAAAAGPGDSLVDAKGRRIGFTNSLGYTITLDEARLHIGAVYLNQTVFGGGPDTARGCFSAGIYSAEARSPLDVDLLSPAPQPFAAPGDAITVAARSAEVWLNGGPIDAIDDTTPILRANGTVTKDGDSRPFSAVITVGRNRDIPSNDPSLPGLNPICKQRIVRPIVVDITPAPGRALLVRADPRAMFNAVDFAALPPDAAGYVFADDNSNVADQQLYGGLRAETGTYQFEWK